MDAKKYHELTLDNVSCMFAREKFSSQKPSSKFTETTYQVR
jgi:hypothetical protein